MFCMIHIDVKVFLEPTPLVKKSVKVLKDYIYIYMISSTINLSS
jgi:hypothetical protein